ncbi:hypothetical protein ACHAPD_009623 [Fusarium lateritium]
MARLNKPLSTRPTARRKDPACGTCRKKCRKCDRKRPICDRCRTKGLQCEGYPPKFQFQNSLTVVSDESEDNTNIQDSIKVRQSPQESLLSAESPDANFPIFDPQQALLDVSDTSFLSPIFALTPVESPPQLSIAQVDSDPIAASDIDLDSDIIANQYILYYCKTLPDSLLIFC